jgi:adenylate cyclase
MRRRVTAESEAEFPVLRDYRATGMTEYVAIINRFAPEGIIGEMDCVYSSWVTALGDGFADAHIATLTRVVPTLALAVRAAALARMTGTLMETYLGRDAGRRVLSGCILRGVADRIDAAIRFSDPRGFTRITDSAPEQVIPCEVFYVVWRGACAATPFHGPRLPAACPLAGPGTPGAAFRPPQSIP